MLKTAAELFAALRDRELEVLRAHRDLGHPGMIGDMYEGLTRQLVRRVIPTTLDLRVVGGKAVNFDGTLSGQLDVMIVVGEGERVPHTSHHLYPVEQIVAVVEVKKRLTGQELADAAELLKTIRWRDENVKVSGRRLRRAFRSVARRELPRDGSETDALPIMEQLTLRALLKDSILPLRIVLGYGGFKTERGFRAAMRAYLESALAAPSGGQRPARGFGPAELPNLVLSGDFGLVKANGMPYAGPFSGGWWPCYLSAAGTAPALLLEVIWTRLVSMFPPDRDPFGGDLTVEGMSALLWARGEEVPAGVAADFAATTAGPVPRYGWRYEVDQLDGATLQRNAVPGTWAPHPLTDQQQVVLTMLAARGGRLPLRELGLDRNRVGEPGAAGAVAALVAAGLVYVSDAQEVRPLVDNVVTVILPDGRMGAAEASDPRLLAWLNSQSPA